jgi:hypothetical protein
MKIPVFITILALGLVTSCRAETKPTLDEPNSGALSFDVRFGEEKISVKLAKCMQRSESSIHMAGIKLVTIIRGDLKLKWAIIPELNVFEESKTSQVAGPKISADKLPIEVEKKEEFKTFGKERTQAVILRTPSSMARLWVAAPEGLLSEMARLSGTLEGCDKLNQEPPSLIDQTIFHDYLAQILHTNKESVHTAIQTIEGVIVCIEVASHPNESWNLMFELSNIQRIPFQLNDFQPPADYRKVPDLHEELLSQMQKDSR